MLTPELRADCARCAALCCVVFAFDRSKWFASGKPAGAPCSRLNAEHRCTIHDRLAERGFRGCAAYDCLGAGQRVVQELFAGRSWREDIALLPAMTDSFRAMRLVHELLLLLRAAAELPLSQERSDRRTALQRLLEPSEGWTLISLGEFERGSVADDTRAFLRSLRPVAKEINDSACAAVMQTG